MFYICTNCLQKVCIKNEFSISMFQILYLKLTGTHLHLDIKKFVYIGTCFTVIGAFGVIFVVKYFPPRLDLLHSLPFAVNAMMNAAVMLAWLATCRALSTAGVMITRCYKVSSSRGTDV